MAAADSSQSSSAGEVDLIALYDTDIRPKKTGVYSSNGYHFFHQRLEKSGSNTIFAKMRRERTAMAAAQSAIFAWLAEHEKDQLPNLPSPYQTMNALSTSSPSYRAASRRFDLPCSIFGNECDENGEFIYAIAVADNVLAKEVAKGKFSTRPQTIRQVWRDVVCKLIKSASNLEFFTSFGVCDLATLTAAEKYGVCFLNLEECEEDVACRTCIADISAAILPETQAAKEYRQFLGELHGLLKGEFAKIPEMTNASARVRVMLLSFASCPVDRDCARSADLERCADFLDQTQESNATCRVLVSSLSNAPGSELLWVGVGEAMLRLNCPHLAAAAFRNAIRLNRNNPFATDRLAEAYHRMGFPELAKALALMTFGLTDEPEFLRYSKVILEIAAGQMER